jgi:hypothetical protein
MVDLHVGDCCILALVKSTSFPGVQYRNASRLSRVVTSCQRVSRYVNLFGYNIRQASRVQRRGETLFHTELQELGLKALPPFRS